jgi:DNA-binding MarR family transcriptional regulator
LGVFVDSSLAQLDLRGTGYCASFNFRRAARAVTRLYDNAFQGTKIRSTQFTILIAVAKAQPASISTLGSILVIDSTTLTRTLAKLQKQGFLTISKRAQRRQRFVALTEAGVAALAQALPGWRAAQKRFEQAIVPEFWTSFRRELERLAYLAVALHTPPIEPGPAGSPT